MISEPRLDTLPVVGQVATWTRAWATWFTEVWQALMGWRASYYGTLTKDWGTINAHTESSETLTVSGALAGDNVIVTPAAKTTGIVETAVVTATDTVTVYAQNATAANVVVGSKTYKVIVFQQ